MQGMEGKVVIQIAAGSFHSMALTEDINTGDREVWVTGQELGFEEQNLPAFSLV